MPKILVVEDSKEVLSNISMLLRMNGYEVFEAENGQHGFETAKKQLPDLIVLDVMLPEIDGIELLTRLRRESDVYVILLTAKTEETDRVVFRGTRCSSFHVAQ